MGKFNKQSNREIGTQINAESDSSYARKMIRSMTQMQADILKMEELSPRQKGDLRSLHRRLNDLNLRTEDMDIKSELIRVMSSLN